MLFSKYKKRKEDRVESRYYLEMCENTACDVYRLRISLQKSQFEDIFWSMNLTEEPLEVFRQCHEFWTTLRRCLEVCSSGPHLRKHTLTTADNAHVSPRLCQRKTTNDLSRARSNLHSMQSRAKTDSEHVVSLYHLEGKRAVATTRTVEGPPPKQFIVTVPNSRGAFQTNSSSPFQTRKEETGSFPAISAILLSWRRLLSCLLVCRPRSHPRRTIYKIPHAG